MGLVRKYITIFCDTADQDRHEGLVTNSKVLSSYIDAFQIPKGAKNIHFELPCLHVSQDEISALLIPLYDKYGGTTYDFFCEYRRTIFQGKWPDFYLDAADAYIDKVEKSYRLGGSLASALMWSYVRTTHKDQAPRDKTYVHCIPCPSFNPSIQVFHTDGTLLTGTPLTNWNSCCKGEHNYGMGEGNGFASYFDAYGHDLNNSHREFYSSTAYGEQLWKRRGLWADIYSMYSSYKTGQSSIGVDGKKMSDYISYRPANDTKVSATMLSTCLREWNPSVFSSFFNFNDSGVNENGQPVVKTSNSQTTFNVGGEVIKWTGNISGAWGTHLTLGGLYLGTISCVPIPITTSHAQGEAEKWTFQADPSEVLDIAEAKFDLIICIPSIYAYAAWGWYDIEEADNPNPPEEPDNPPDDPDPIPEPPSIIPDPYYTPAEDRCIARPRAWRFRDRRFTVPEDPDPQPDPDPNPDPQSDPVSSRVYLFFSTLIEDGKRSKQLDEAYRSGGSGDLRANTLCKFWVIPKGSTNIYFELPSYELSGGTCTLASARAQHPEYTDWFMSEAPLYLAEQSEGFDETQDYLTALGIVSLFGNNYSVPFCFSHSASIQVFDLDSKGLLLTGTPLYNWDVIRGEVFGSSFGYVGAPGFESVVTPAGEALWRKCGVWAECYSLSVGSRWLPNADSDFMPELGFADPDLMPPQGILTPEQLTLFLKEYYPDAVPSDFMFDDSIVNGDRQEVVKMDETLKTFNVGGETIRWTGSIAGATGAGSLQLRAYDLGLIVNNQLTVAPCEKLIIQEAKHNLLIGAITPDMVNIWGYYDPPGVEDNPPVDFSPPMVSTSQSLLNAIVSKHLSIPSVGIEPSIKPVRGTSASTIHSAYIGSNIGTVPKSGYFTPKRSL